MNTRQRYGGEAVAGTMRTSASLGIRLGQTIVAAASLFFMCLNIDFYSYTAYCYLVTVMGLTIPWNMTQVLVDAYSVLFKSLPHQQMIVWVIITGDWILSLLSLSAAASTASVTDLLLDDGNGRTSCPGKLCTRYQLSAAMAFLSWFLLFASSLFNLWQLPSR